MVPEQEQRLLGFFVEEAKEHLQTIEAGLLHLPQTLQQPAMVHEIFRAAHSLKGGAAMLGISSIQHIASQFEDDFKILQEQPHLPVDTKLESLLLRLLNILQTLVQQLASQNGLTAAVVDELMAQAQPLCTQLHEHLQILVQAESTPPVVTDQDPDSIDLFDDLFTSCANNFEFLEDEPLQWEEVQPQPSLGQLETEPMVEASWFDSLADMFFEVEEHPTIVGESASIELDLAQFEAEAADDQFSELAALLDQETTQLDSTLGTVHGHDLASEFDELEQLLDSVGNISSEDNTAKQEEEKPAPLNSISHRATYEQTMRVSVKQLDNISNLVGELVVYRNSLEQDQSRLRQFLDSLLHQVQQLNDVGSRMQALYEKSLLEASLLTSRHSYHRSHDLDADEPQHATGVDFDALEMDRFTGFHTLSQEMLELIVRVRESSSDIEFIVGETEQVARQFRQATTSLQESMTRSRMIPFAQIADRLPRAVRDIALQYGKQANLTVEGRDILIDKVLLEQLYDPMTHLVNNAITHGIETPEARVNHGKPPLGQIQIQAFHQGNQTVITVADDGAGIDPERVKAKAVQKGLITPQQANRLSRTDTYDLLFHPGFSTKDEVDNFAGRGIGMDVVFTSLREMRGSIHIDSMIGQGTTFTIRLPLTLSICKALCCLSEKARIAFPMDGVEDMLDVSPTDIQLNSAGQPCISWHNSLLPFRPLKELLKYNRQLSRSIVYGSSRDDGMISVVILRSGSTRLALQVDQVIGEQEIVIKQFEGPMPKPVGVSGATIMGDGRIVPIADVLELIDLAMGRLEPVATSKLWDLSLTIPPRNTAPVKTGRTVLIVDDSITVRELLSMTFSEAGYRVEQARDGQEAWDKLRDGLPCDLVFCDIEMPRMDGLELLSRMQKDPKVCHLPIAMLTSRGADRHRQMAIQLGASGYFTKPYLEEVLLDAAQRMLRGEVMVTS